MHDSHSVARLDAMGSQIESRSQPTDTTFGQSPDERVCKMQPSFRTVRIVFGQAVRAGPLSPLQPTLNVDRQRDRVGILRASARYSLRGCVVASRICCFFGDGSYDELQDHTPEGRATVNLHH